MSSFKELNISNPGTSSKYGGNDTDLLNKLFNGVTSGIPAVKIKSTNKFGFWDGVAYIRNQSDNRNTTIRGQSNTPATDVDLRLPPITTNDMLSAVGLQNIWLIKQQFNDGILYQEIAEPTTVAAGLHQVYIDSVTKHLTKKDSAGIVTDYDTSGGGGGAGGIGILAGGTSVQSGNASTKIFNIPHGLSSAPLYYFVGSGHPDSVGPFYYAADATYIYVIFPVAPPTGANNVVLRWIVTDPSGITDMSSGNSIQSGNASNRVFNIPHGLGTAPQYSMVGAGHADSIGPFSWTVNSMNIVVTYPTAPPTGSNNVVLRWTTKVG